MPRIVATALASLALIVAACGLVELPPEAEAALCAFLGRAEAAVAAGEALSKEDVAEALTPGTDANAELQAQLAELKAHAAAAGLDRDAIAAQLPTETREQIDAFLA